MENRTHIGLNRTGMEMSPTHMKKMQEVTELTTPSSEGDEEAIARVRLEYIAQAEPVGTVPPPMSVKGVAKTGMKMMSGMRPQVFLDKLGERAAFERTGTRLYEAFMTKCRAPSDGPSIVSLERLRHFCEEEAEHFKLVVDCIVELGGDPTTQTPCADVAAVESMGLLQVITDPKTTVNQALHAILVGELTDNAAWEELIVLAREMGMADMAERFEEAARNEMEHLEQVREWHRELTLAEAKPVTH